MTIDVEKTDLVQEDQDTYRDPDKLYSIASWAERLALPVMLVMIVATLAQTGIQVYAMLQNGASGTGLTLNLGYFIMNTLRDLSFAALAYFILQGIAQGLYMLMDIEEKNHSKD